VGHANTRTTERYARPDEEVTVREVAAALDHANSAANSRSNGDAAEAAQVVGSVGAGNGGRTRDIHLGKVALYR
jgi:hypothetical protein